MAIVVTCMRVLSRLIKDSKQKVFLIVDNLRVDHSYVLAEWFEKNKVKIELFFLPSYAPKHNPDACLKMI